MKSKRKFWLGAAASLILCGPAANARDAANDALFREIYKELVEINTTDSTGDTLAAANAMAKRLLD